jgi:hypothetical protein
VASAPGLEEPCHLHCQGGGTRNDTAVANELAYGAKKRQRVDTAMLPEPLILIGHECVEIA